MADSEPPKILGVEMWRNGHEWQCRFGQLECNITVIDGGENGYDCGVGIVELCVCAPLVDCIAAIERELLAIRDAIPEPPPNRLCSNCSGEPPKFMDGQCLLCGEGGK